MFPCVDSSNAVGIEKMIFTKEKEYLLVANRAGLHFFKKSKTGEGYDKIKAGVLSTYGVHSVFMTPSGHILAQETGSNDLVLLKASGQELARHAGKPSDDCGQLIQKVESARRNCFIGNVYSKIVWPKGKSDIAIVDLNDFSFKEIKGIIPYVEGKSEAVITRIVHNKDCDKICFVFVIEQVHCIGVITKESKEPNIFLVKEILPKSKPILT